MSDLTSENLKKYLKELLSAHTGMKRPSKLIDNAILLGTKELLGTYPWAFKEVNRTVTTTSGQETVDLPDDFDALISVIEHTSTNGGRLHHLHADKYDRLIPYSENLTTGTPAYYKIFHDADEGIWKLALYPTPNAALSLYLKFHTLGDAGDVPDKYVDAWVCTATKYLFLAGSRERRAAGDDANVAVQKLIMVNEPSSGPVSEILDSSKVRGTRVQQWYEDP